MGTNTTSRTLLLLAGLGVAAWCVWLIHDILPPFVIAVAFALLLDPAMERMQKHGVPRWAAVTIAFMVILAIFFGIIAILLPRAIGQVSDLVRNFGKYSNTIQLSVDKWFTANAELLKKMRLPPTLGGLWRQYQDQITGYLQVVLDGLIKSLQSSVGMLGWVLVVPIVTLYVLMDLERLKKRINYCIPEAHREMATELALRVGQVFAAYVRGLVMVCASYGLIIYLVLELVFGLQYAIVLGVSAVVLYAIPYLGQLGLLVATVLISLATGHSTGQVIGVAVSIVVVGQLFDQLITPRVMGKQVGLHPVLGLFALMVGGQLFGLPGMVVAVPVAASARVVLIHLFPRLAEPLPGEAIKKRRFRFRRPVAEEDPAGASG